MTTSTLTLRWLGTAGFHMKYKGQGLLLDPFLSRPLGARPIINACPADFKEVSLIMVSHGHFDHAMDIESLARVTGALVYAPLKTCTILRRQGIDPATLHPNERYPTLKWNEATIRILPSRHIHFDCPIILKTLVKVIKGGMLFKIARLAKNYPLGSNSDFLMNFKGYKVLFSGSGGGDWKSIAQLKPNCLLIPFAGRSDLTDYYLNALRILKPETVILHHFDIFFPSFCVDYPVMEFRDRALHEFPALNVVIPETERDFTLP